MLKKFWTQSGAPAGAVKALSETRFFEWVRRNAPRRVTTTYDGATKRYTTTTVFDGEREKLVDQAPLGLLRTFGVTGELSRLMWQVECQVRDKEKGPLEEPEYRRKHGRMGELRRVPTHLRVLMNLACST